MIFCLSCDDFLRTRAQELTKDPEMAMILVCDPCKRAWKTWPVLGVLGWETEEVPYKTKP